MRPDQQHIDGVDIFIQLGIAACDKFKVRCHATLFKLQTDVLGHEATGRAGSADNQNFFHAFSTSLYNIIE